MEFRFNSTYSILLGIIWISLMPSISAQNTPIVFPLDPSNYSNNALPPKGTSEGFTFNLRSSNNGFYGWNVRIDPDSLKVHVVNLNPVFAGSPSRATWVEQYPGPGCRYLTLDTNNNLIFGTHVYGGGWSYDTVQADEPATVLYRVVQITNDHLVVFWANAAGQDRIWVVNRAQKTIQNQFIIPLPPFYATPAVHDSSLLYHSPYGPQGSFMRIGYDGTRSWMPITHNLSANLVPEFFGSLNGVNWILAGYQDVPAVGFPSSTPALGKLDSANHVVQLYHLPFPDPGSVQLRGHHPCPQDQAHYITYHVPYFNMGPFDSVVLVRLDPGNSQNDTLVPTWKKYLGTNQEYQNSGVYSDGVHVFTHNRYYNSTLGVYQLEIKIFDASNGNELRTEHFALNPHLEIRPNPNNGDFEILCNEAIRSYRIFNLAGQCVRQVQLPEPTTSIRVNRLPQGIWTFEGLTDTHQTLSTRVMVE